ncbi:MAG: aspartate aminotransferase family protein [Chitinophagaceae bacterium]|jgi:glutamate/tyrosine decarboxylase-like PLP-dependent enzyme|nr:aspartate aminotransferase family protein [Chitinophagaceae bacterium]
MNELLANDMQSVAALMHMTQQQGVDFFQNLAARPTSVQADITLADRLPETGLGAAGALQHFNTKFEPLIVGSSGPRYWGFVTGGATPAAIMGDMLAGFYDQNTQSVKGQGDVSANIELETIRQLLDLFDLPRDFLGGFVTGATLSNFTCLAVARQWIGRQQGDDIARDGMVDGIKILSALPHSSTIKSLSMLGIGSNNIIRIKVQEGNRESMDMEDLQYQIAQLHGAPFILIASAGTVNTVDFDDFKAIARVKAAYDCWLHIDGAFGAFAACSPAHKQLLEGWEVADSITIDCHKWLNVPYESAFFLIREKHKVLQTETFQNSNAPYLGNPLDHFSYLNFLPENSRRLRALPAWFTLQAYGKKGYQDIVTHSIAMAQLFSEYVEQSGFLDLLAPTRLNNVCFTLKGREQQDRVQDFLVALNATGKVFMTPTVYNGWKGIRASFVNWRTTPQDIALVIEAMESVKP